MDDFDLDVAQLEVDEKGPRNQEKEKAVAGEESAAAKVLGAAQPKSAQCRRAQTWCHPKRDFALHTCPPGITWCIKLGPRNSLTQLDTFSKTRTAKL